MLWRSLHQGDKSRENVVVRTDLEFIGHSGKYHNTLCLCPQIFHKHCFQFLLGNRVVPRENKNNAYAKFGGTNKEYYGIFRTGLLISGGQVYFLICWTVVIP